LIYQSRRLGNDLGQAIVWRGWQQQSKGWVEFTVRGTANSLRANRRRAERALHCEDEEREEEDCIDVWLADYASYLNRPLNATTIDTELPIRNVESFVNIRQKLQWMPNQLKIKSLLGSVLNFILFLN
jgi:hypothetical protein